MRFEAGIGWFDGDDLPAVSDAVGPMMSVRSSRRRPRGASRSQSLSPNDTYVPGGTWFFPVPTTNTPSPMQPVTATNAPNVAAPTPIRRSTSLSSLLVAHDCTGSDVGTFAPASARVWGARCHMTTNTSHRSG